MAQFEYLLEWNPRKADFWRVSNVTHHICQEFHDVDEAFDHIATTGLASSAFARHY